MAYRAQWALLWKETKGGRILNHFDSQTDEFLGSNSLSYSFQVTIQDGIVWLIEDRGCIVRICMYASKRDHNWHNIRTNMEALRALSAFKAIHCTLLGYQLRSQLKTTISYRIASHVKGTFMLHD